MSYHLHVRLGKEELAIVRQYQKELDADMSDVIRHAIRQLPVLGELQNQQRLLEQRMTMSEANQVRIEAKAERLF